ncbi:MAG: GNAT family N-acetyltransferase [Bryobacteraceae bacterium]|jgi:ribosomal protein S18 acetylase RimI-like enzyme
MTPGAFRFEALGGQHDCASFRCGEDALDRYLQTQATQDIRRNIANCFVAVEVATARVAAYYTLSAASIPLVDLPPEDIKHLPRYPTVPAVRIGRLAVDRTYQGRGLGAAILMDGVQRIVQGAAAAFAMLVDAKNDEAVAFYRHNEFRAVMGRPRTLFLPIATMQRAFARKRAT